MTTCTICGAPTPGTPDDDAPCCSWCDAANFAHAEVRPPTPAQRAQAAAQQALSAWPLQPLARPPLDGAPWQAWQCRVCGAIDRELHVHHLETGWREAESARKCG